jgi:hypothetical protein
MAEHGRTFPMGCGSAAKPSRLPPGGGDTLKGPTGAAFSTEASRCLPRGSNPMIQFEKRLVSKKELKSASGIPARFATARAVRGPLETSNRARSRRQFHRKNGFPVSSRAPLFAKATTSSEVLKFYMHLLASFSPRGFMIWGLGYREGRNAQISCCYCRRCYSFRRGTFACGRK